MPERIQLRRTRGWRLPPGAVNVARPTRWGNPFKVGTTTSKYWASFAEREVPDAETAVALFAALVRESPAYIAEARAELRGRDLACWCPLADADGHEVPCHAAILLEIANAP